MDSRWHRSLGWTSKYELVFSTLMRARFPRVTLIRLLQTLLYLFDIFYNNMILSYQLALNFN
jgi:hypothetical protein